MSIEELLGEEPPITIMTNGQTGTDASGLPLFGLVGAGSLIGRIGSATAHQLEAWHSLGIEANYSLWTQDTTLEQEMLLKTYDNRVFRVVSLGEVRYAKGGIPTHLHHALQEERRK